MHYSVSLNWFSFWFYSKMRWSLLHKTGSVTKQPLSNTVRFQYLSFNSNYSRVPTESAKVLTEARWNMYLLLAVRSHWKPEGWWAKRSRGHRAFRIFWTPTHPGANLSRPSPITDSTLCVTTRSDETLFSWNSRDKLEFGCKNKEATWSLFSQYCQTQKHIKSTKKQHMC